MIQVSTSRLLKQLSLSRKAFHYSVEYTSLQQSEPFHSDLEAETGDSRADWSVYVDKRLRMNDDLCLPIAVTELIRYLLLSRVSERNEEVRTS